jgi:hypothetical protein
MGWLDKVSGQWSAARRPNRKTIGKDESMNMADLGIKGKVFCLSMQRSGTSSVGDFLEQWGLKRMGHQLSRQHQWSRHWFNGDYGSIFDSDTFREHEVYEDDPFWFPDFYKYVYHRVPDSRFVLLYRDSDSWFKSMVRHSQGYTLGFTDIHSKVYRREDELRWLEKNIPDFKGATPKAMVLYDKAAHYKAVYERHIAEIEAFFKGPREGALFMTRLADEDTWPRMKEWLGLPDKQGVQMTMHTHKAKTEFTRANLLRAKAD